MYKRGCWDEEKEEKWIKNSQKMVCSMLFFNFTTSVYLFR